MMTFSLPVSYRPILNLTSACPCHFADSFHHRSNDAWLVTTTLILSPSEDDLFLASTLDSCARPQLGKRSFYGAFQPFGLLVEVLSCCQTPCTEAVCHRARERRRPSGRWCRPRAGCGVRRIRSHSGAGASGSSCDRRLCSPRFSIAPKGFNAVRVGHAVDVLGLTRVADRFVIRQADVAAVVVGVHFCARLDVLQRQNPVTSAGLRS